MQFNASRWMGVQTPKTPHFAASLRRRVIMCKMINDKWKKLSTSFGAVGRNFARIRGVVDWETATIG